ncbi:MAG TPA: chromosomal replication initiator DnaA [Acetobacteraceae bacterium]|nr:chromosomal replication initiator DnaA [Acetobacteraceae bacterium]
MNAVRQLALPFPYAPGFHAEDFIAAPSNAAALAWLDRAPDWPGRRLALWGEAGCGKTHLLHVWAARHGARLVPAPGLRGLPAPPEAGGVAVDDADAPAEETALLHLLNAAAEAGLPVLLAGRAPPARWQTRLPDLASRLRATAAVGIGLPDDDLMGALLVRLLSDRQLAVPPGVRDWLLARLPRSPASLREAAARLDRAGLANGGRITRALAASILADLEMPGEGRQDALSRDGSKTIRPFPSPPEPTLL